MTDQGSWARHGMKRPCPSSSSYPRLVAYPSLVHGQTHLGGYSATAQDMQRQRGHKGVWVRVAPVVVTGLPTHASEKTRALTVALWGITCPDAARWGHRRTRGNQAGARAGLSREL